MVFTKQPNEEMTHPALAPKGKAREANIRSSSTSLRMSFGRLFKHSTSAIAGKRMEGSGGREVAEEKGQVFGVKKGTKP